MRRRFVPSVAFLFNLRHQEILDAKFAVSSTAFGLMDAIAAFAIVIAGCVLAVGTVKQYTVALGLAGATVVAQSFHLFTDTKGNPTVDYTYAVPINGKLTYLDGNHPINEATARRLAALDELTVRYLPDDPSMTHIDGDSAASLNWGPPIFEIGLILIALAFGVYRLKPFVLAWRNAARFPGRLIRATLTRVEPVEIGEDGRVVVRIAFKYTLPFFRRRQAEDTIHFLHLPGQPEPRAGMQVWLLYRNRSQQQVL